MRRWPARSTSCAPRWSTWATRRTWDVLSLQGRRTCLRPSTRRPGPTWGTETPCSATSPPTASAQVGVTIPGSEVFSTLFKGPAPTPACSTASPPPSAPATRPPWTRRSATSTRRRRRCRARTAWSAPATTGCSGIQSQGEARLDTVEREPRHGREHRPAQDDHRHADPADGLPGRARRHRQDHPALARRLPALTRTCRAPAARSRGAPSALTRLARALSVLRAPGRRRTAPEPDPRIPQVRAGPADEGGGQDDHPLPRTGGAPPRSIPERQGCRPSPFEQSRKPPCRSRSATPP